MYIYKKSYKVLGSQIYYSGCHKYIESHIYVHRKSYKILGSNNTVSFLFYEEKSIFIIKNWRKKKLNSIRYLSHH